MKQKASQAIPMYKEQPKGYSKAEQIRSLATKYSQADAARSSLARSFGKAMYGRQRRHLQVRSCG